MKLEILERFMTSTLPEKIQERNAKTYSKRQIDQLMTIIKSQAFISNKIQRKEKFYPTKDEFEVLGSSGIELLRAFETAIEPFLDPKINSLGMPGKLRARGFAEKMKVKLRKVKNEGITSAKGIADRFNELGYKTSNGSIWRGTQVKRLIATLDEMEREKKEKYIKYEEKPAKPSF
ncbi:MAG: hypothetical protein JXR03_18450 [Cyclobacteriaceae bacterium]